MGTPLGPTFANFYMCYLENKIFSEQPNLKPPVYCRYVDDIFLMIDGFQQLEALKNSFTSNSVLEFTYEIENRKKYFFPGHINNSNEK